jgi:hypothetical protein
MEFLSPAGEERENINPQDAIEEAGLQLGMGQHGDPRRLANTARSLDSSDDQDTRSFRFISQWVHL